MKVPRFEPAKPAGSQIRRYTVLVPNPSTPGTQLPVGWVASKRFWWPGYRNGRLRWIAYVYQAPAPGRPPGAFVETTGGKLATWGTRQAAGEALVRVAGMGASLQQG